MWYKQKFFKIASAIILLLLIAYLSILILPLLHAVLNVIITILLPTIFAAVLYYIFRPLREYLENKGMPRLAAIAVIFILLVLFLSILIVFIWPFISQQIENFTKTPKEKLESVENRTIDFLYRYQLTSLTKEELRDNVYYYMSQTINFLSSNILTTISSVAQIATYIIVTPFLLFYFLKDDHQMSLELFKATPEKHKDKVRKVVNDIDKTLATYISGQVVVAFFVGFCIFIGYWLIGIHYALLLAFFAFVFNLIPFCGPFISTIPALFIGLSQSPWMGVKVILIVITVHLLDVNLISPKIVGQRLNISPITIILLLIASFSLLGLLGVFLITPLYAVARTLIWDLYDQSVNPQETQEE